MKYGKCKDCNIDLEPVWFEEEEYKIEYGRKYRTGRKRKAVSHLICPYCMKKYVVDDSFDGNWY